MDRVNLASGTGLRTLHCDSCTELGPGSEWRLTR